MERFYSTLEIKAIDDTRRRFSGIASTPSTDRVGDIVEPKGAQFKLPVPLLWQHDAKDPIGWITSAKVTSKGIEVEGEVARFDEDGPLKDRLTHAWQMLKSKLVRGLSIGFNSLEAARIEGSYGMRFTKWEWLELSAVTIPANQDASITAIKSIDASLLAATGRKGAEVKQQTPGAAGHSKSIRSKKMNTFQEQLAELKTARAEKAARMQELVEVRSAEDRASTEDEAVEFDALDVEVKELDDNIRTKTVEALSASSAKAVSSEPSRASASRGGITVKSNLPKATAFVRYVTAMANGRGSISDALEFAKRYDKSTPEVSRFIKAVAGTAIGGSDTWGSELVDPITREFLELLMPETIIGKITGFRAVPFNTRVVEHTSGSTANWVGEGASKPVGENSFDAFTLPVHKCAGIVVLSDELVRLSTPAAETTIRDDLVKQISKFLDEQFIDPTVTVSADNPASVTQGVTPVPASGATAEAFRTDMRALRAAFRAANMSTAGTVLVMNGGVADALGDLMNAFGQPEFPGIMAGGGTYRGSQIVTSESVPTDSTGSIVVMLKPSDIMLADDGSTRVDASREATINMGGDVVINLWQQNMTAIRAERWITWLKARSAAVQYISGANYGEDAS